MVDLAVDAGREDISERSPTCPQQETSAELPRYNRAESRAVGQVCPSVVNGLQFGSRTTSGVNCEVNDSGSSDSGEMAKLRCHGL